MRVADEHWNSVVTYSDRLSAEATLGLLAADGLPCFIASDEHVPGLGSSFAVRVPSTLVHRARWMLERVQVSEAELTFLATGQLGGEADHD